MARRARGPLPALRLNRGAKGASDTLVSLLLFWIVAHAST